MSSSALTLRAEPVDPPLPRLRRWLFFTPVVLTALIGIGMMFDILRANGITPLEIVILLLFAVTFSWIAIAFWTAAFGFALQLLRRDPLSLRPLAEPGDDPIVGRTALAMPIHNEDPARVMSGLAAMLRSLADTGQAGRFDVYLLSDTTDPAIAREEQAAWAALRQRFAHPKLYYRHRSPNSGRKAGNIADFCRRWGAHYDYMVVLDADSIMRGATLVELVRAMQARPEAGLIQTVPLPARQSTLFGRLVQFAAALYSPMLATGQSFWQGGAANYWGHNAILRTRAFTEHCGLPVLPGRPPLGGEILSHDFVEAALLRRAGWRVYLMPAMGGSYEEVPANVLDYAKRDRRWTQGNLQHLKLLAAPGLHPLSRLHFLLGATAYIASLLWLLMLLVSTLDAMLRSTGTDRFFHDGYQLFPDWPIAKTGLIISLLAVTLALLLLPKLLGLTLALLRQRQAFGGGPRLLLSAGLEMLFAILIAPLMMLYHARFVLGVLRGHNVVWAPQNRDGRGPTRGEAWRHTAWITAIGLPWAGLTLIYSPVFFWWLTPIFAGLLLAAPLVRWTGSRSLGLWTRHRGLFLIPSETTPPAELLEPPWTLRAVPPEQAELPPELPRAMPVQTLDRKSRYTERDPALGSMSCDPENRPVVVDWTRR